MISVAEENERKCNIKHYKSTLLNRITHVQGVLYILVPQGRSCKYVPDYHSITGIPWWVLCLTTMLFYRRTEGLPQASFTLIQDLKKQSHAPVICKAPQKDKRILCSQYTLTLRLCNSVTMWLKSISLDILYYYHDIHVPELIFAIIH